MSNVKWKGQNFKLTLGEGKKLDNQTTSYPMNWEPSDAPLEMFCHKHGSYTEPKNRQQFPSCPKCADVVDKGLCSDCEQHQATKIPWSDSAMAYIHGSYTYLCTCCQLKRVEEAYLSTKANYERLKDEVANKVCS